MSLSKLKAINMEAYENAKKFHKEADKEVNRRMSSDAFIVCDYVVSDEEPKVESFVEE